VSYDEKPGIQAIKNIAANLLRHSRAGGNPEGEMTQPCVYISQRNGTLYTGVNQSDHSPWGQHG